MSTAEPQAAEGAGREYVCVSVGEQLFGLPIERVRQVFRLGEVTRVPLAPVCVAGLINLRGRVATAIDLRSRLGLPATGRTDRMAVGLDLQADAYGLVVDDVGDVMVLAEETREDNPAHLGPAWLGLASCVHRLSDRLLVVLDVDAVLDLATPA